jgi:hypothetical protein
MARRGESTAPRLRPDLQVADRAVSTTIKTALGVLLPHVLLTIGPIEAIVTVVLAPRTLPDLTFALAAETYDLQAHVAAVAPQVNALEVKSDLIATIEIVDHARPA